MILTGISLSRMDKMYFTSEYQTDWDKHNFVGKPSMRKRLWHSLTQDLAQTDSVAADAVKYNFHTDDYSLTFVKWNSNFS